MRRLCWPLLIWLLAVALPAQGLAAAVMLHCAPTSRAAGDATALAGHGHADAAHAGHRHHDGQAGGPAHTAHHHAAGDDPAGDQTGPALHKCSACAACVVGLGLPSTAFVLPQPHAATAVLTAPAVQHVAFFTSGPERPPRTLRH
jgi:hypothetical protein